MHQIIGEMNKKKKYIWGEKVHHMVVYMMCARVKLFLLFFFVQKINVFSCNF